MWLRLRHIAEYLAVRVALSIIQAVSIETCDVVCRWMAYLAANVWKIRGRVVDENLQIAFPEMMPAERQRITKRMWHHLLLMVCEVAHLQRKIHETNWRKFVDDSEQAGVDSRGGTSTARRFASRGILAISRRSGT